LVKYLGIITRD